MKRAVYEELLAGLGAATLTAVAVWGSVLPIQTRALDAPGVSPLALTTTSAAQGSLHA